jgi:GT2 family glycosyltransferase
MLGLGPEDARPALPALRVAVCTNREPRQVADSLAALRGQVPPAYVVLVTSGLGPRQVAAHRAAHDGPVLEEPLEGLSHARNRALAWCGPEYVLAYVDDDAVVADGWWGALCRRWAEAPGRVACIGGPIRPRYAADPPGWLSAPLLPTLTVLDLGTRMRDLDPAQTTVYGANVSFRVGPLRDVGGFDPRFGHSARRVFFSEEDEAQRALAARGFGVRYVPDALVWHVISRERLTRGSFLRRRYAYGRALGRRGGRAPRTAARQVLSSGAGVLVAAARRQDALLMERAVRVAENVGVIRG